MTDGELERLARAATAGPWEANPYDQRLVESKVDDLGSMRRRSDGEFIAAFNPSTALALLERVRRAEAAVSESAEWARALEVRIGSWRELTKKAEERAERLRVVGAGLANVAYNLKQLRSIPEEHRRSLDEGQRAWDAAAREEQRGATMSTPGREDFESDDGFYGVTVERTADGLRLSAGSRNRDASAILSPAKAREFALAILRQADAMGPLPSLLDEYRATDSERAMVRTVARAAAEEMREKAARRLEAIAKRWREGPCSMAFEMIANFNEAAALVRAIDLPGEKP